MLMLIYDLEWVFFKLSSLAEHSLAEFIELNKTATQNQM